MEIGPIGASFYRAGAISRTAFLFYQCSYVGALYQVWPATKMVVQFPGNINVRKVIEQAAEIVGMENPPEFKVTISDTGDW